MHSVINNDVLIFDFATSWPLVDRNMRKQWWFMANRDVYLKQHSKHKKTFSFSAQHIFSSSLWLSKHFPEWILQRCVHCSLHHIMLPGNLSYSLDLRWFLIIIVTFWVQILFFFFLTTKAKNDHHHHKPVCDIYSIIISNNCMSSRWLSSITNCHLNSIIVHISSVYVWMMWSGERNTCVHW